MTSVLKPVSLALLDLIDSLVDDETLLDAAAALLEYLDAAQWHMDGYRVTEVNEGTLVELQLPLAAPAAQFDVPGMPQLSLSAGLGDVTDEEVQTLLVLQDRHGHWLELQDITAALEITPDFLMPLDPAQDSVRIEGSTDIRVHRDGEIEIHPRVSLSLPPSRIFGTDIVVALDDLQADLGASYSSPEIRALGYGAEFRGIYATSGTLHILPMCTFAGLAGLTLDVSGFAVSQFGVSGAVRVYYALEHDGVTIDPASSEQLGELLSPDWPVALRFVEIDFYNSEPTLFRVAAVARVPVLDLLLEGEFGIDMRGGFGEYGYTLSLAALEAATIDLIGGELRFAGLSMNGALYDDTVALSGSVSGFELAFGPVEISAGEAQFSLAHAPDRDEFRLHLGEVQVGPLPTLDNAELVIRETGSGSERTRDVRIEAQVSWEDLDLANRLGTPVPDHFPDLPGSGVVSVFLSAEHDTATGDTHVVLRFSAELEDVDNLWPFVPVATRPEVRSFTLQFEAVYDRASDLDAADTTDRFQGKLSAALSVRLPDLPDFPGSDLIELDFGDVDGWMEARLEAGIDDGGDPYMTLGLTNAVSVNLQLPGMPQDEAPVQTRITDIAFDLAASDDVKGSLRLTGEFEFHPILPDVGLPIADQMEALMGSIGLDDLSGTATLQLAFDGGDAALSLDCLFHNADIEIDVIDMVANLARGLPAPDGAGSEAEVPLDLEVGFAFKGVSATLGSLGDNADAEQFSVALEFELRMAALMFDVAMRLSDREFTLGIPRMEVPLEIPRFPLTLDDLDNVRQDPTDSGSTWDASRWNAYETVLEQDIAALRLLDDPRSRRELFRLEGQKFLLANLFGFYGLMSGPTNEDLYRFYAELFVGASEAVSSVAHLESSITLVLTDVQFVIPFSDPRGIALEGSAHLEGFAPDDPLHALEGVTLGLGLSAEYIYFALEAIPPIPLPDFGRYRDGYVSLSEFRLGYGYTKNSFSLAFNGEVALPPQLVEDADTSGRVGVGIRMPFLTALKFKLDLIPVTLGAIDFIVPLVDFDLDLRKPGSQALVSSENCEPFWDGLQIVAPGVYRHDFKHLAFSPLFSMLPIPNVRFDGDLMIGDESNGLTIIADNILVLYALQLGSTPIPIPLFADVYAPYFENLCMNVRLAGFGVNFNLQRPFPSVSPLALFEIIALLSDPSMEIDPEGHLANIMRVTLRDARISMPEAALRIFPAAEAVVDKNVYINLNLGTVISAVQHVAEAVSGAVEVISEGAGDLSQRLQRLELEPPDLHPGSLLAALPPELRKLRCSGSFAGFEASAVLLLIDSADAAALREELALRDRPAPASSPPPSFDPSNPSPRDAVASFRPNFSAQPVGRSFQPEEPSNSLFAGIEFRGFDDDDLDAIPAPRAAACGVIAGARVKVFEGQRFRFLGAVFEDGSFGFVSATDIEPLKLRIAGIDLRLPLELHSRLTLMGRAKRDGAYGSITAEGSAKWKAIPGVLRLEIGSRAKPARLKLHSDGTFRLAAAGKAVLFNGAAMIDGSVDVSETHCFIDGRLAFAAGNLGGTAVIAIDTDAAGRIGPGRAFELSGAGNVSVLGASLASASARVTQDRAAIEGRIDTGTWRIGAATVDDFRLRLALQGAVDLRKRLQPEFDLRGDGSLEVLGARIDGSGGLRCKAGMPSTFVEGALRWQGQDWLEGRIEASPQRIAVSGRAAVAVDLTPSHLGSIYLAGLFLRLAIGGRFELDAGGGLASFSLRGDWQLAGRLAGGDQTFPLASQSFAVSAAAGPLDLGLVQVAGFKLLPEDQLGALDFEVPVPRTGTTSDYDARVEFGFVDDDGTKNRAVRVRLRRNGGTYTSSTLKLMRLRLPKALRDIPLVPDDVPAPRITDQSLHITRGRLYMPFDRNFEMMPVQQAIELATDLGADFGIGLTWTNDNHLAIKVSRPGQSDFIKKLSNIAGV